MLKWCPKQSHQHWGCETMDSVSTLDENIFNFYFDRVIEGVDGLHGGGAELQLEAPTEVHPC